MRRNLAVDGHTTLKIEHSAQDSAHPLKAAETLTELDESEAGVAAPGGKCAMHGVFGLSSRLQ